MLLAVWSQTLFGWLIHASCCNDDLYCASAVVRTLTLGCSSGVTEPISITDNGDGTHTVNYTPANDGPYTVCVKYAEQEVPRRSVRPSSDIKKSDRVSW